MLYVTSKDNATCPICWSLNRHFFDNINLLVTKSEGVILTLEMVINDAYIQCNSANPIPLILALRDFQEKNLITPKSHIETQQYSL